MTRKKLIGVLCVGLVFGLTAPSFAGWGSSFGGGGSFGSSFGSGRFGHGGSFGSNGKIGGGQLLSRLHSLGHGSSGGSRGGGSFGGGGFLHKLISHHRSFGSTGSGSGIFGGSSGGGSTGLSKFRSAGSWGGGSSGGSTGSGLFHGGLISKLKAHHQKKMSWLRSRGSKGGSWGGSTGGSSHGGSSGSISYATPVSQPIVSTPVYSEPIYESSYPVESYPVESYPVESYPVESYPAESYPVESYPVESYPIETYPMESSSYPVESYPVESAYPVESYEGGPPVESAVPVESTPVETTPIESAAPIGAEPTLAEPVLEGLGKTNSPHSDAATIAVSVPDTAKLFVNGIQTKSTGIDRQFVSKGLKPGFKYPYLLKAVMNVDGQEVVMTKDVTMRAGELSRIAFDFDTATETALTVRLPEDAELRIAGAKTRSTGSERKFTTRKLKHGQSWEKYEVVVTIERDGQRITREQIINLRAGEDRTLTFDFDLEQVAAR